MLMLFTELVSALCPPVVSQVRSTQGRAHNPPFFSEDCVCVTKNHISFIFFSLAIQILNYFCTVTSCNRGQEDWPSDTKSFFFPKGLKLHIQESTPVPVSWTGNFNALGMKEDFFFLN